MRRAARVPKQAILNGKHSVNLQKRGSTRFLFGLIIAMTMVYIGLEASFETLGESEASSREPLEELAEYNQLPFTIEVDKPIVKENKPRVTKNPTFEIVPDDFEDLGLEEFIDEPSDEGVDLKLGEIEYKYKEPTIEEVIFIAVEDKPIFPGCENVEKYERLACFTSKMQEHIKDNFDYPDTAIVMGLKGRVFVNFKINTEGYITDVKLRGPHKILEKEAFRIINKLPRMTPGNQRGFAVRVPFSIPINFQLQ